MPIFLIDAAEGAVAVVETLVTKRTTGAKTRRGGNLLMMMTDYVAQTLPRIAVMANRILQFDFGHETTGLRTAPMDFWFWLAVVSVP